MGYNTKQYNHSWWTDQLNAGRAFRKKYAHEERWNQWRSYYRGNWTGDVLPVNLFFMMARAIVPRVYFRNPSVSVTPAKPGPMNAAFAQLLDRIDNKQLRRMNVKRNIKKIVQDAFMFGTGIGKMGYGAIYTPTPEFDRTADPLSKYGRSLEYDSSVQPNMPWFSRVATGDYIVPMDCEDREHAMWEAHDVVRPLQDVKQDSRFKNTDKLVSHRVQAVPGHNLAPGGPIVRPMEMVELTEIRDKMWGRVIVIARDYEKPLYMEDDELQTTNGAPFFDLVFNNDDQAFWGVPDSQILEPHQLEINEVRTQEMKHRRVAIIKLLYLSNSIDETELDKMVSEDVAAAIRIDGDDIRNSVMPIQTSNIPRDLFLHGERIMGDVRETIGFSRNQSGEYEAGTPPTATEATLVQMSSEVRVDERRDMVGDMIGDIVRTMHQIIFKFWGQEEVVQVTGPLGIPLWIAFKPQMLSEGSYEIRVDPDSSQPLTKSYREQKALVMYDRLKENPLIDPVGLTRYLLREMHGVDLDDLMRGMPKGAGLTQPMELQQYAQLLQRTGQQNALPQKGGKQ